VTTTPAAGSLMSTLILAYANLTTSIRNFRRGVAAGIPLSGDALRPMTEYTHRQLDQLGPGFEYSASNVEESIARVMENARIGTDAACIVFAHSALDAHLSDCLRVVAAVAPELWRERLSKRQASLGDVEAGGYQTVFHAALMDDLAKLEKESVMHRMSVLFDRCPGAADAEQPKGYQWNVENLKRIDALRHNLVHRGGIAVPIDGDGAERDFDYLLDTGFYVLHILRHAHGVRLGAASTAATSIVAAATDKSLPKPEARRASAVEDSGEVRHDN
jgi:hypothetical protein